MLNWQRSFPFSWSVPFQVVDCVPNVLFSFVCCLFFLLNPQAIISFMLQPNRPSINACQSKWTYLTGQPVAKSVSCFPTTLRAFFFLYSTPSCHGFGSRRRHTSNGRGFQAKEGYQRKLGFPFVISLNAVSLLGSNLSDMTFYAVHMKPNKTFTACCNSRNAFCPILSNKLINIIQVRKLSN